MKTKKWIGGNVLTCTMADDSKKSTYTIPCSDIVHCVEFSPYEWSCNLLAVSTSTRITIYSCRFEEEDAEVDGLEYTQIRDFQTSSQTSVIAWNPETSLTILPKFLSFATAEIEMNEHNIHLFTSDLKENDNILVMKGHSDFVNSITFDPSNGSKLASTGDDLTCRIWGRDGNVEILFRLTSPGMSVCWHQEEPLKILVAQKNGVIRMFSLHNQQPIMSFNTRQVPLMDCDWSKHDSLIVGVAANTDWLVFNTSVTSKPIEKRQAHTDGVRRFRWSRCHESLLATIGRPGRQIKVFNTRHPQLHVNASIPVAYGLTWHLHLPILAVGGDKMVHLWLIEST